MDPFSILRIRVVLKPIPVIIPLFIGVFASAQGSLVIVDPTISGDTVTLPIHLQGNVSDGVAAMDFQLSFDATILQPVQVRAGAAAVDAGKEVQARVLADGQYTVLMFGVGRSAVSQGEVARVALNKIDNPKAGETPVTIEHTTFATVSGVEIPSLGSTTTLQFERESGDGGNADSLPPIFGGGTTTAGDQTPAAQGDETATPTPDASNAGGVPAGDAGVLDLAEARAAAGTRISMLQEARAKREAARINVARQGEAGNEPTAKARARGIETGSTPNSPGLAADPRNTTQPSDKQARSSDDEGVAVPAQMAQQEPGAGQPQPVLEPPLKGSGAESFPGREPVDAVEAGSASAIRRQAAVIAGCLFVAVVIFGVQRYRRR